MTYVADLHVHSPYARGTSPALSLETLSAWGVLKGIDVLATADFTHPAWLAELKAKLTPLDTGLFMLPSAIGTGKDSPPKFILGTEVSCVYPQAGRTRRVHLLVFAPDFAAVDRLCAALSQYGALASDGRPVLKLSARDCAELALSCDARCEVVPAHAWTPWYSVYGSKGGFESLADCFGDMLAHIHAVETGLSSDPAMNWAVPELASMALVSFSDAHSAPRLGRELTVFQGTPSYEGFRLALRERRIASTIEFFPEEGKYHYDGHRACNVSQHPSVSSQTNGRCPGCGRGLTLGVLHRIQALSAVPWTVNQAEDGLLLDPSGNRPPFRRLVPLEEIIAEFTGRSAGSKGVRQAYLRIVAGCDNELHALTSASWESLADAAGEQIAGGVLRARQGRVEIAPGYDGVYGKVRVGQVQAALWG